MSFIHWDSVGNDEKITCSRACDREIASRDCLLFCIFCRAERDGGKGKNCSPNPLSTKKSPAELIFPTTFTPIVMIS
jgi:hypothetical protein